MTELERLERLERYVRRLENAVWVLWLGVIMLTCVVIGICMELS